MALLRALEGDANGGLEKRNNCQGAERLKMGRLNYAKRTVLTAFQYSYLMRVFASTNGALLVYWLARRAGGADPVRCIFAASASFCAIAAAFSLNDATDVREDLINNATRPVAAGNISTRAAITVYMVLAIVALLSGIALRSTLGLLTVAAMLLAVSLYSVKIKPLWAAKNIFIAGTVSMLPILAWSSAPTLLTLDREVAVAMLFLWSLEKEVLADIRDLQGDTCSGLRTLARRMGRLPTTLLVGVINVTIWGIFLTTRLYAMAGHLHILLWLASIQTAVVLLCAAVQNPFWVRTYLRVQVVLTVAALVLLVRLSG